MTEEKFKEKLSQVISKLKGKRQELIEILNTEPQIASFYMEKDQEVMAKSYVYLCDYLIKELQQLGLIKDLPTILVDKVFTHIFFQNLKKQSEPFTIENLVLFVQTLNSIEINSVQG